MEKFRTLIVEDNEEFRQALADLLQTQFPSMILEEAATGSEVMAKVMSFQPELIFMDLKLPGENGLSLTQKIKEFFPLITVIILTGYELPEYREAAFQRGADYFLPKGSTTNTDIIKLVKSIISPFSRKTR